MNNKTHRRQNLLTGEWVLVSPHRGSRPWKGSEESIHVGPRESYNSCCHLCPGNKRNSGEVNSNYEGVFVFGNDFPALNEETIKGNSGNSLFRSDLATGICRVICYSPDHTQTMSKLSLVEIENVVTCWKEQNLELSQRRDINYIQIFENKGEMMGCSQPHPHGQLWASSYIPTIVQREAEHQRDYFQETGRLLLMDYLEEELESGERILYDNKHFTALVPFWAAWPFEVLILPKSQINGLGLLDREGGMSLAECLSVVTKAYDKLFSCSFPYSMGIHQAPCDGEKNDYWTMHFHFFPPLLKSPTVKKFMVGYEMLADSQRDFSPEKAAEMLRKTLI